MSDSPRLLFSFDFDGTLVDEEPHPAIHPNFNQFLEYVKANNGLWSINTGRTLFQTLEGLAHHRIQPRPDFIMAKERELYAPGQFNRWVDVGDWNKRCLKDHKRFLKSHKRFFKQVRKFLEGNTHAQYFESPEEPPSIISSTEQEMDEICRYIEEASASDNVLSYQRNTIYLRFAHADYSKGTVLNELARLLEITPDQICVAGDNHNDLSMLNPAVARYIICPANAIPEVHAAVAEVGGITGQGRASFGVLEGIQRLLEVPEDFAI